MLVCTMSNHPADRSEYIIRFVCAFFVFGAINALILIRFIDFGGAFFVWVSLGITILISMYAARVGDQAWHRLINFFRWW